MIGEGYLRILIMQKGYITRHFGMVYLIEHHLLYNPDSSVLSAILIRVKY
jgi:hypothetical protein